MVTIPSNAGVTVRVQIIDTTSRINDVPNSEFFEENIPGFDTFNGVCYAFLITHQVPGSPPVRLIFDLGIRKDWTNGIPDSVEQVKAWNARVTIEKNVSEILEGDQDLGGLEGVKAIIWSHAHFDHTGDPSTFPSNVDLMVGPGMKEAYMPGWPTKEDAPVLESCFKGREVKEISFEGTNLEIGGFQALDFFNDGSFYLLNAPGHALGHVNALARTSTGPDTFIYMAGDSFHHASELRPTPHLPLPDQVLLPMPVSTSIFQKVHPKPETYKESHFINPKASFCFDDPAARETIRKLQVFDAHERVLVVAAHDKTLFDSLSLYPKDANGWKDTDVKEKTRWLFLKDLEESVK